MTDKADHTLTPDAAIRDAAVAWIMRLSRPTVGEEDWAAFNAWLDESDSHGGAYDQAIDLWSQYQALANAPKSPTTARTGRSYLLQACAAAAVALALLPFSDGLARTQTYTTGDGETRTVHLADGTQIELNSASRLKVKLGWRKRRVEMDDAEAIFDVAKDQRRPFIITAGDQKIRVVGTRFDVRRRDGFQSVTVERGRVEVTSVKNSKRVALTPGQRLDHQEGKDGTAVRAFDPAVAMSWRSGRLIYREEPLSHVAADLTGLAGPPVRVADARTGDLVFSGVIAARDSVQGAKVLGMLSPVKVEETPAGILLRRH